METMQQKINKIYKNKNMTSKSNDKVYTYCDDAMTFCRFLNCPLLKEYCTLCVVDMMDNTDTSTNCKQISTRFLFKQLNVKGFFR